MQKKGLAQTAFAVTQWVGSPASIVIHTVLFVLSFLAAAMGWVSFDRMLLVLTTIVSLEAIYLAIFIQMTLNFTNEVVEDIGEDVEEMQEDIDEIQEDVDEIQEDVDELQEDVEEMSEDEREDDARKAEQKKTLVDIQTDLRRLMDDIGRLQQSSHPTEK